MTTRSRLGLVIASLALLLVYIVPLWKVTLVAPQYPDGLGMEIWVNTVAGENPHDLQNINGLNHYIGMKRIEPESIPELRLMPWIFGALIVLGLAAAASGKRWALYGWVGLFLITAAAGLIDFYLWEYDYGHNLDPSAAIKVPGMTYQPPLIGSKKLLNFTARSWPALGGIVAFVSCGIGVVLTFIEMRRSKTPPDAEQHAGSEKQYQVA